MTLIWIKLSSALKGWRQTENSANGKRRRSRCLAALVFFHHHRHRLALVDDMHSQEFDGRVANNLNTRMRHVTGIDVCGTSRDCQFLPVCADGLAAFKNVEGLLSGMGVQRY